MNSNHDTHLPDSTLYNLLQQLSYVIDDRYTELRSATRYKDVRPSDIRVFVEVARKARSETEIAQALNVTRQAIQSSVKRLVQMGVMEVVPMPNNGRNKIVQLTDRGRAARETAAEQIRVVESECAAIIGPGELERLRGLLLHLLTGYRDARSGKARAGRSKAANGVHATGV